MKIGFIQSGGFLGLRRGCELDTAMLAPDIAQELERLTRTSGILTSGVFFSEVGRDLQQYDITINDGDSEISVTFDDETLPPTAQSLVNYLQEYARPKPYHESGKARALPA